MSAPSRYPTLAERNAGRPIWDNLDPAEQARREVGFAAALAARDMCDEVDARQAHESAGGDREVSPAASPAVFEPRWARARR